MTVRSSSALLLVGDEPALAAALEPTIPTCCLGSAELAIAVLTKEPSRFGAVLADYGLPLRSGLWLLEECQERWPTLRRILICSHPAANFAGFVQSGVLEHVLPKPVVAAELVDRLARARPIAAPVPAKWGRRCMLCRGSGRISLWLPDRRRLQPGLCVACGGSGWSRM